MMLASLAQGRDGRLVAVRDGRMGEAPVRTLRDALDEWDDARPALKGVQLDRPFDESATTAPLPRAADFLDGSAYVNHVELVRRARGAEMPEQFWTDPLMYQGSGQFAGAGSPIPTRDGWGADCEAEVAVIVGDVPMGASPDEAADAIRLIVLINDVSLRGLIPAELSKGFGFVHGKPPCAMSPLALTPDELSGWDGRILSGTVAVDLNGSPLGRVEAGEDMVFDFGRLVSHAAATRSLGPGTVIGSGTVSNREEDGPGRPVAEGGRGYTCLAEQRTVETILHGRPRTRFLSPGDRVSIRMEGAPFGTIEQKVVAA